MEKKPNVERKTFIVNIEKPLYEQIDGLALANNLTQNEMVEILLKYGVLNAKGVARSIPSLRVAAPRAADAKKPSDVTVVVSPQAAKPVKGVAAPAPNGKKKDADIKTPPKDVKAPPKPDAGAKTVARPHAAVPTFKIPPLPKDKKG